MRVPSHQTGVADCLRHASAAPETHRPRPVPQVQAEARADGRSCRPAPRRHPACARPRAAPAGVRRAVRQRPARTRSSANPGSSLTSMRRSSSSASSSNMLALDSNAEGCQLGSIFRPLRALPVHAQPERRPLVVRGQHRIGVLSPSRRQGIDQPARMRAAHREIAIDLRFERRHARAGTAAAAH